MSEAVPPRAPFAPSEALPRPALTRGVVLVALVVLLGFITTTARTLWGEWSVLRTEMSRVRTSAVIGYPGINPQLSFAAKPTDWFRDEGEATLLWAGWKAGVGHRWFQVARGDVDRAVISYPLGRDTILAIDHPVVERGGGTIWGRIPDDSLVAGHRVGGNDTAYPVLVLDKVIVVNDTIGAKPVLVASNPFVAGSRPERIVAYESVVDGRRVTMGMTGYILDGRPLLYDRGTESLWVAQADAMRSIGGAHKGRVLRRVARPVAEPWGRWRSQHPDGRLVVGGDRSLPRPAL